MRHRQYLISVVAFLSLSYAHAQTTSVSGFVNPVHVSAEGADDGFMLGDAALYFTHTSGKASLNVDLPFTSAANDSTATPNAGAAGTFAFAEAKAQANIGYQVNDSVKLVLGQFDTLYGFELNDAKDRFFSRTGLVYEEGLNVTHTGLLVEGKVAGVTLKAVSANRQNAASPVAAADSNREVAPEYGAQASYGMNNWYVTVGHLASTDRPADEDDTMTDVIAGAKFGAVALDLEYVMNELSSKDEETWMLVHAVYSIGDKHKIGLRYEMGEEKDGSDAGGSDTDHSRISLGFRCIDSANLWWQVEGQTNTEEPEGADKEDQTAIRVGGVYTF